MQKVLDNILIVEATHDGAKLFQLIFNNHYKAFVASNSEDAFILLKKHEIKVVISDNLIVGESVISFFENIEKTFPFVQKILLTDFLDHRQISEAIDRGRIFSYITKPIEPQRLLVAVYKAIDQYNLLAKNTSLLQNLKFKNQELKQLLNELKFNEEKFRNIFNASPDPILIINDNGYILDCNPLAKTFFYNEDNQTTEVNIIDLIKPSETEIAETYIKKIEEKIIPLIEVSMWVKNNNKYREFELNGYPVKYHGEDSIMITLRDLSIRKEMEMKMLQTIIQTEEKERRRFAEELHDGIGPLLSTTKLYLNWLTRPESKMDKGQIIIKMEETLEDTIASLREISNNISPNTLMNFGLNTALKTFISRIKNVSGIDFQYKNVLTSRIKQEIEITLYRLICECINNSIKHSGAKNIDIYLFGEGFLELRYSDNGKGFDVVEAFKVNKGSGLINMKTRVQSLGGEFKIESSPEIGTIINVKFIHDSWFCK